MTSADHPATRAAMPPQRAGFPETLTMAPPIVVLGAPHTEQYARKPRSTVGTFWPHRGHMPRNFLRTKKARDRFPTARENANEIGNVKGRAPSSAPRKGAFLLRPCAEDVRSPGSPAAARAPCAPPFRCACVRGGRAASRRHRSDRTNRTPRLRPCSPRSGRCSPARRRGRASPRRAGPGRSAASTTSTAIPSTSSCAYLTCVLRGGGAPDLRVFTANSPGARLVRSARPASRSAKNRVASAKSRSSMVPARGPPPHGAPRKIERLRPAVGTRARVSLGRERVDAGARKRRGDERQEARLVVGDDAQDRRAVSRRARNRSVHERVAARRYRGSMFLELRGAVTPPVGGRHGCEIQPDFPTRGGLRGGGRRHARSRSPHRRPLRLSTAAAEAWRWPDRAVQY